MADEVIDPSVQSTLKKELTTALQDGGGRFASTYIRGDHSGDGIEIVKELDDFETQKRVSKHGDTPNMEVTEKSRWCKPGITDEFATLRSKDFDMLKLSEPSNAIHGNLKKAFGRAFDDAHLAAIFGKSFVGNDGTKVLQWNDIMSIESEKFGSTAVDKGLNINKLLWVIAVFEGLDISTDSEDMFAAFPPWALMEFLGTDDIKSNDYNSRRLLEKGRIDDAVGFNFIQYNRLPLKQIGGDWFVRCPIWCKSGMYQGMWSDVDVIVNTRADKNNSRQIQADAKLGNTRLEEKKVMEILLPVPTGLLAMPKASDFAWSETSEAA